MSDQKNRKRQPAGLPVGGEYAKETGASTGVNLPSLDADISEARLESNIYLALAYPETYPVTYDAEWDPSLEARANVGVAIVAATGGGPGANAELELKRRVIDEKITSAGIRDWGTRMALADAQLVQHARNVGAEIDPADVTTLTAAVSDAVAAAEDASNDRMFGATTQAVLRDEA